MFNVSIAVKNNKILTEFIADSYFFVPSKYEYAYYLYKDDERVAVEWYTKKLKAIFDIKDMTGDFYIKVFVKDVEYEDARSYTSETLVIGV